MPEIKLQHIVSVSSENKNYPAENLLKPEGFKKWKSSAVGEKQVSVTIQFEKATEIRKIDIGNEGSMFVEVLVGKSASPEQDFQVILVASAFMKPNEARNGTNLNQVRNFGEDQLSKAVLGEKWDRVKIVCTQPFNKNICYGLSFIKFYSEPDKNPEPSPKKEVMLGGFKLKAEDSEDAIRAGSWFADRHKKTEEKPLTGAAAVRAASRAADEEQKKTSSHTESQPAKTPVSVKRKSSTEDTASTSSKPSASAASPAAAARTPLRKQSTSLSSVSSAASSKRDGPPPLKKTKTEPSRPSKGKQFSALMEDVVFVLSGFQNPERGKIRDRAMDMGADYKPDWGRGCTHLICAFQNTPKYNAVKGKGRIVTKDWIRDCYKQKKLLPWREYRLGKAPSPPGTDEEDNADDIKPAKTNTPSSTKKAPPAKQPSDTDKKTIPSKSPAKPSPPPPADDDDDYGGSTDVGESEGDTDDEIQRLKNSDDKKDVKKITPASTLKEAEEDPYAGSTDEEDNGKEDGELPPLPSFFKNKCFFLYGDFNASDRHSLRRCIIAYDGSMEEYMGSKVTHVLTREEWDSNFDTALEDNTDLVFVKPDWIFACDKKQKTVPHQKFIVVPK